MQLPCYVCGASESRPWASENGHHAVRCRECGLVYVSPRPPLESISRAAQTGLHAGEQELAVTGAYAGQKVALYARRLAELYGPGYFHGAGEHWLDVGAGFGEFLEALSLASGGTLRARGLEPNETKAASARERGLAVTFVELSELGDRFNYVSLLNVYSHLPDPPDMLARLRDLLAPGGELLLQTGNFAELEQSEIPVSLDLPDHLSFASERLLVRLLERAGFTPCGCRSYPMFPAKISRFGIKRAPSAPERQCLDVWLRARKR